MVILIYEMSQLPKCWRCSVIIGYLHDGLVAQSNLHFCWYQISKGCFELSQGILESAENTLFKRTACKVKYHQQKRCVGSKGTKNFSHAALILKQKVVFTQEMIWSGWPPKDVRVFQDLKRSVDFGEACKSDLYTYTLCERQRGLFKSWLFVCRAP